MSHETINIGPAPAEEDCAQVGNPDYEEHSQRECRVFKRMLERRFPPVEGARLIMKSFPHDFGSYREVCVVYDPVHKEVIDYAYALENNVLTEWDDTPRAELAWFTERYRYQARVRAGKLDAQRVPVLFLGAMPPVFAPDQLQQLLGLKRHRHSADNTKDHHYGN